EPEPRTAQDRTELRHPRAPAPQLVEQQAAPTLPVEEGGEIRRRDPSLVTLEQDAQRLRTKAGPRAPGPRRALQGARERGAIPVVALDARDSDDAPRQGFQIEERRIPRETGAHDAHPRGDPRGAFTPVPERPQELPLGGREGAFVLGAADAVFPRCRGGRPGFEIRRARGQLGRPGRSVVETHPGAPRMGGPGRGDARDSPADHRDVLDLWRGHSEGSSTGASVAVAPAAPLTVPSSARREARATASCRA